MATNGIFQSVDGVGGIYILAALPQWPDRAPAWGCRCWWGSARWRIRSPSHSSSYPGSAATRSLWHLLHSISLKGDTGANQSRERPPVAPCTGCPGDLSSAGGLSTGLSSIPPPPTPSTFLFFTTLPLSCLMARRWQVPLDGSLTVSLRQDLRLPSYPVITHIPSALFELSHINSSWGAWRATP